VTATATRTAVVETKSLVVDGVKIVED